MPRPAMDRSLRESVSQSTVRPAHANRTLVIMAKAPKPGRVKTRLMESFLARSNSAVSLPFGGQGRVGKSLASVGVVVVCPESDRDELANLLGNTVRVGAQEGEALPQDSPVFFDTSLQPAGSTSSRSIATVPTSLRQSWAATFEILVTHDVVARPTRWRLLSGWRKGRSLVAFRSRWYGNRERAR